MTQRWRPATGQRGQATFTLILVVIVVAIAVVLLFRVASTANSINDKADSIAGNAVGINEQTGAVGKLPETNRLAASILETAEPLEGQLNEVIRLAQSIDGLATSINGTAGEINNTAKGINGAAASILGTARAINDGVAQININLDTTLALANAIKTDTGNILGQAAEARSHAACIDRGVLSGTTGRPAAAAC